MAPLHPPNRRLLAPVLGPALAAGAVLLVTTVWQSAGQALPPPQLTRTAASGQPSPTRSVTAAPSAMPTIDALAALVAGTATANAANAGGTATPLPTKTPSPTPVPPSATRTATPAPFPTVPPATATTAALLPLDALPPNAFVETFDANPSAPQPWTPVDWDLTTHGRDLDSWWAPQPMPAQHGPDCGPYPGAHQVTTWADAVFLCRDHLMTALSANGYGAIVLTPPVLADFSQQEAVVRFDLSTLRTSSRDWVDLWLTPYGQQLQLPLEDWLPDLTGYPRNAVHVRMTTFQGGTVWGAEVVRDFAASNAEIVAANRGAAFYGQETVLAPSATVRTTVEIRVSRTHLKVGLPQYDYWWVDSTISDLGWDRAVVQFGHHGYSPTKGCDDLSPGATCGPNTWHWDNVTVAPAVPFTIIRGDRRAVDHQAPPEAQPVVFPVPAPAGAMLRFAARSGTQPAYSTDGGATWAPARLQPAEALPDGAFGPRAAEVFASYWTPVPAGTSVVLVRGSGGYWGSQWMARDFSLWAPPADTPPQLPSATATLTATHTPLPTATATPPPAPSATATGTPLPPSATPTPAPSATAVPTVAPTATEVPPPTATATTVVGPDPTVAALAATVEAQDARLDQLQRNQQAAGEALLRGG